MDKLINWWRCRRPTRRRLAQLYCALLMNAHLRGFASGQLYTGQSKALCVPGLNCYSCPGVVGACPLGALQQALAAADHSALWYVGGLLLLFGAALGRTVCGWLCPFGLLQELLHKIPTPKIKKSRVTRVLSYLKYLVLAVFVVALPLLAAARSGVPLPAFCKYLCPAGTAEGAWTILASPGGGGLFGQLGWFFTQKSVLLVLTGLACVFCYRAFCRFFCPLGAVYSLFSRVSLLGMRVDESRCTHCGACVRVCGMDVRCVGDRECIACGQCVSHCAAGAIHGRSGLLRALSGDGKGSARLRLILRAALLLALLAALVLVHLPGGTAAGPAGEPVSADTGSAVGEILPDFSCELLDGSVFRLSEHRGQTVIINQWATYCAPCVAEMPHFLRLKEEHPEVGILAFHHYPELSPSASAFAESLGWTGRGVDFAADTADQRILQVIGGDNVMPRTLVVNARGQVVFNEQRSMTYEMLLSLLSLAEE